MAIRKTRYRRRVRTAQEHRAWDVTFGRLARSPSRLPDYYDEMWRFTESSWKRHRATQYKVVDMGRRAIE